MAKDFAKTFYTSDRWKACRKAYISERVKIDGGICERCGEHAGYMVHHKINLTPENITDPNVALNGANLEFLCKKCHDKEDGHFLDRSPRAVKAVGFIFSEDGQPIPSPQSDDSGGSGEP